MIMYTCRKQPTYTVRINERNKHLFPLRALLADIVRSVTVLNRFARMLRRGYAVSRRDMVDFVSEPGYLFCLVHFCDESAFEINARF